MNSKKIIWLFAVIGGYLGGYIPLLWGGGYFSFASIMMSGLGSLVGIWIGFKLTQY